MSVVPHAPVFIFAPEHSVPVSLVFGRPTIANASATTVEFATLRIQRILESWTALDLSWFARTLASCHRRPLDPLFVVERTPEQMKGVEGSSDGLVELQREASIASCVSDVDCNEQVSNEQMLGSPSSVILPSFPPSSGNLANSDGERDDHSPMEMKATVSKLWGRGIRASETPVNAVKLPQTQSAVTKGADTHVEVEPRGRGAP